MEPTSIDLKSISGRGIKSFTLFQNPSLYAIMSVADSSNSDRRDKKTAVDSDGGENPEWDGIFRFNLATNRLDLLALEIDVMAQGSVLNLSGDKLVGKVIVPIADLKANGEGDGPVRHVSYQVVGTDGKANGVLHFTVEFTYPAATLPSGSYYSPQIPVDPPCNNYYATPRQQDPNYTYPVVASPGGEYYPPPRQQDNYYPAVSSPVSGYYPPQGYYPPVVDSGYYSQPPPPPPLSAPAGCYPPPQEAACCYPPPAPSDAYGYGPYGRSYC